MNISDEDFEELVNDGFKVVSKLHMDNLDNLAIVVEDEPVLGLHHPDYFPGTVFIGGGPPPNYSDEWAQIYRRVYNVRNLVSPVINIYGNLLASKLGDLENEFPNRILLNSNGLAQIDTIPNIEPDIWYSGPLYDRVRFFDKQGGFLGGKKISTNRFSGENVATEASADGRWGFVGSSGGRIEVVDLQQDESLKIRRNEKREVSISEDRKSAVFSIESLDRDHYPHRRPPSYIATWKAHEKAINDLLIVSETDKVIELASFAIDNTIKKWALNKRDLGGQISPT